MREVGYPDCSFAYSGRRRWMAIKIEISSQQNTLLSSAGKLESSGMQCTVTVNFT
jgi:hypothetical protein